ncbi:MAG TPA: type II toxin-antitoxin system VapC family toxin [Steroidobacteraceae bacterium]|nr:type II toxin-antitoxin system VapC family toxin [Steroidobacteraceae bacterium]
MSAARFMLDTNICIYIAKRKPQSVLARFEKLKPGEAVLSVVTYGELRFGASKSNRRDQVLHDLEELTSLLPVQPLPVTAAAEYGRLRFELEAEGRPIGGNDLWIAAHASAEGLTLVTNNLREFKRVPGLKVQNWAN